MNFSFRRVATSLVTALLLSSAAAADDNYWLAVGHGGQRMLSSDGKTWTQVGSWGKPGHNQDDLNVAASFKGGFYVGGGYFSGRLPPPATARPGPTASSPAARRSSGSKSWAMPSIAMDLRGKVFKTVDGEKWEAGGDTENAARRPR